MGSPSIWVSVIKGLPASLAFIFIVDWNIGSSLVDLYKVQMEKADEYKLITLIAFMSLVVVNIVIISFFARGKYLEDKQLRLAAFATGNAAIAETAASQSVPVKRGRPKKKNTEDPRASSE